MEKARKMPVAHQLVLSITKCCLWLNHSPTGSNSQSYHSNTHRDTLYLSHRQQSRDCWTGERKRESSRPGSTLKEASDVQESAHLAPRAYDSLSNQRHKVGT